jgi:flagellar export protein FliJ
MKAFQFSLQSLLVLRTYRKELAYQRWTQAVKEYQQVALESERARTALMAWQEARRKQQSGMMLARDLVRNQKSAAEFYRAWVHFSRLKQDMENKVRQAMREWTEARREEEILERLRKRSWMKWQSEAEKEEQKLNDERATLMAYRVRREAQSAEVAV